MDIVIDGSSALDVDSIVARPINPLLSVCGYQVLSPTAFHCSMPTVNTHKRKKVKRTIYQACSGNNKANADTFLATLKQGNAELLAETAVYHDSSLHTASLR